MLNAMYLFHAASPPEQDPRQKQLHSPNNSGHPTQTSGHHKPRSLYGEPVFLLHHNLVSKNQGVLAAPKVKQFLHGHQTAQQKHNYRYISLKKELSKDMVISAHDIFCLKP